MLVPDYHTHTSRCGHASGGIEDYVRAAVEAGLPEIGVSDHFPMGIFGPPDPSLSMAVDELDGYVSEAREVAARYADRIVVRLGTEADFLPGIEEKIRPVLARTPFDYVIGSIHFIDGWGFDDERNLAEWKKRDVDKVWLDYLDLVRRLAQSRLYDILGHPDLPKKFGHRPSGLAPGRLEAEFRSAARELGRAGMAVEINTSGLRKPVAEMYPSLEFLRILGEEGVGLVFGSDAHGPQQVGSRFADAIALARQAGYAESLRFQARKGRAARLP